MALKKVVYLSNEDYNTLITDGSVTVNGTTITYSTDDIYLTPDNTAQKFAELQTSIEGLQTALDAKKLYKHSLSIIAQTVTINGDSCDTFRFRIETISNSPNNMSHSEIFNAGFMQENHIGITEYTITASNVSINTITWTIDVDENQSTSEITLYLRNPNDELLMIVGMLSVTDTVTEIL